MKLFHHKTKVRRLQTYPFSIKLAILVILLTLNFACSKNEATKTDTIQELDTSEKVQSKNKSTVSRDEYLSRTAKTREYAKKQRAKSSATTTQKPSSEPSSKQVFSGQFSELPEDILNQPNVVIEPIPGSEEVKVYQIEE